MRASPLPWLLTRGGERGFKYSSRVTDGFLRANTFDGFPGGQLNSMDVWELWRAALVYYAGITNLIWEI